MMMMNLIINKYDCYYHQYYWHLIRRSRPDKRRSADRLHTSCIGTGQSHHSLYCCQSYRQCRIYNLKTKFVEITTM